MAERNTYSALSKQTVTVAAYSTATLEYMDTLPNYFRVQNLGSTKILCGTSAMPSSARYDFAAPGEGMKMYAEPFKRSRLYLYNPSGSDITCVVLSFQAPFDPLTLALSEISLSLDSGSMEVSNVIAGFESSLPAGINNIGKVTVENMTDYSSTLESILSALANVGAWTADDVSSLLSRVYQPAKVVLRRDQIHTESINGTATSTVTAVTPPSGRHICKISFVSNDGESDLTFNYTDKSGTAKSIILKSGEVLNDLDCIISTMNFTGNSVPYRCVYITELTSIIV